MISAEKKWLAPVPWDQVVQINQSLCQNQPTAPHRPGAGFEATKKLWEEMSPRTMTLQDALNICKRAHESAPFGFFNGNTLAVVTKTIVEEVLKDVPPVEAQIVRTSIAHYVAGVIKGGELTRVFRHFDANHKNHSTKKS